MKTREKILEAALALFNTRGYQNVGVREIARELAISPGNLSYHFARKEDILTNLLTQLRENNNTIYKRYADQEASLANFLALMQAIFNSQFSYRGVFIGNQQVNQFLRETTGFNYATILEKRKDIFRKIYHELLANRHMALTEEDVEFLVNYITLFGRFWLQEALLLGEQQPQDGVITHYLKMLSRQMGLFATEVGKQSITAFWEGEY